MLLSNTQSSLSDLSLFTSSFSACSTQLRCDFCSKPYTNYMSLRNHMRIHGQKRYMCDLCGKAFRLARYLRNHQRIHDDGPNRFDCPSCCKSYRTMLELAQHRCTAAASNQVGLRRHDALFCIGLVFLANNSPMRVRNFFIFVYIRYNGMRCFYLTWCRYMCLFKHGNGFQLNQFVTNPQNYAFSTGLY